MSKTETEPPLQIGTVELYYELDISWYQAKKRIKERTQS